MILADALKKRLGAVAAWLRLFADAPITHRKTHNRGSSLMLFEETKRSTNTELELGDDLGRAARPRVMRRMAAIVAADMVGYSLLMGADEEGTARRLRGRQVAASSLAKRHGGRTVKIAGDAMLFEFSSTIAAVQCAVAIQQLLEVCNEDAIGKGDIFFRIGINFGNVIVEGDDVLGKAVNVAARLEAIAEPGGVCLSRDAYEQCKGATGVEFVDWGKRRLKNIAEPVRVYALRREFAPGSRLFCATDRTRRRFLEATAA